MVKYLELNHPLIDGMGAYPGFGNIEIGAHVIIRTGWDKYWGEAKYHEKGPHLSMEFVELLVSAGSLLVGVDFLNVDNTNDKSRPVHTKLLYNDILIVENLQNLGKLPRTGFKFSAIPLRIVRGASFPVRAFAEVGD